jgi:uncharacterized protein YjbI with pentapeptide repeats
MKIADQEKFDAVKQTLILRGLNLEGAVFLNADLRKVDLTKAQLQGASLAGAQLQGAILDNAQPYSMAKARLRGRRFGGIKCSRS